MIAAVIARLLAAGTPFKLVAGLADLAALRDAPVDRSKLPHAYVMPISHRADANPAGTLVVQQILTARLGVLALFAAAGERHGEKAVSAVEPLYAYVRRQLVGWRPADTTDEKYFGPFVSGGGYLSAFSDSAAILGWLEMVEIKTLLRSV